MATYEQVRKRAADIAAAVEDRTMPPWKPVSGVGLRLKYDRSLPAADRATLLAWVKAGAPPGDAATLPPAVWPAEGWALGTPDLIVEMPDEFDIPAEGADLYRCFVLPTALPGDMYVAAVEYQPGNARVVHHIVAFVDTSGGGRAKDAAESGPGYMCLSGSGVSAHGDLGGWAPGNEPSPVSYTHLTLPTILRV